MKRNLTIIIIGLLLFSYGHLMMPPEVQDNECLEDGVSVDNCDEEDLIEAKSVNKNRPFAIWGGGIIAIAGGFLVIGD